MTQTDLFGLAPAQRWPRGLLYTEDLIDAAEAAGLVAAMENLPFRPFQFHGYQGAREVVHFGSRWDYSGAVLREAAPMPDALLPVRRKAAAFAGRDPALFSQALLTRYAPGAPIGWHRDRPVYDEVIGVSLLSPCRLRLRRQRQGGGWDRAEILTQPRSAYLFSGEARSVWEHSIPPVEALRYSITFRSLAR